ncbi:MAG: SufD family Fe-S cluster assembly protein [Paludibacteraceae bacterium]|nr:SufD family Fe-S cluster assembly protein [Paludibacteraceae bacterium]
MTIHTGETFEHVYLNEPTVDLHIVQEAGSRVKIHVVDMPGDKAQGAKVNSITVEQTGENCSTEIYALAYLKGNEQVSTDTHVTHKVGNGTSNQLIKFVLDEESRGRFVGELKIAQDAQCVEAHQTNRNILLSEKAEMRTQPQLEIYADDVKATHGASTGQLDDKALFYMQQRGIGKQKARQLLVGAFIKDVLMTISDEELRERLLNTIDGIVE